jgi:predicted dienelactone hydrolase
MVSEAVFLALPIFALVLFTSPSQAFNAGQAGFELPQPNGCHPVGTRTVGLRDPHRSRDLLVTMWYPAVEGTSAPAPYMDKKTAEALAEEWKLQLGFQRLVRTHARLLAPIAEGTPFPVVLLEHGSSVVPAIYTVLAEGLASSGFVVVATNHPPESLISMSPETGTNSNSRPTGPLKPIDELKAWPLVSSRTRFWWQMYDSFSTSSRK